MRRALLLAVLLTPACSRHSSPKAEGPSPPSKEAVISYLEGKEVPMPLRNQGCP